MPKAKPAAVNDNRCVSRQVSLPRWMWKQLEEIREQRKAQSVSQAIQNSVRATVAPISGK